MTQPISAERGASVRFPPPLVFVGFIVLGIILRYVVGPLLPAAGWTRLLGAGLLLAGVAVIVSARTLFVRTGQHPAPWKPSPELILRGPYRFTRNPMYLGLTCIQAGLGLVTGNGWITVLAPVALLMVHFIAVRPEERYLTGKFGSSYRDYCHRVRRYI
jgi:protein-S-isoprenylcysteine O-methyltransferase Ste14